MEQTNFQGCVHPEGTAETLRARIRQNLNVNSFGLGLPENPNRSHIGNSPLTHAHGDTHNRPTFSNGAMLGRSTSALSILVSCS